MTSRSEGGPTGASLTTALALVVIFAGIPSLTAFFILCTAGFIWVLDRPLRPADQHVPHPRGGAAP